MATTVKQSFREFASNLEITDKQVAKVSERRSKVVDALTKELSLHSNSPSKLIGSYDRNTMIRYLSEGDVDLMVALHYGDNKHWANADGTIKVLDKFRYVLDGAFPNTEKRRDRNCICISFPEFRLDVVPAFRYDDGHYTIPDSVRKLWVPTDPFKFAERITSVNKNMDDCFVPLVKMVKGWNRQVGSPLGSFHLECIMYNRYCSYTEGYSYSSMLRYFFEVLPGYLNTVTYDPVMGDRVDTYLDNNAIKTKRQIAIEKAMEAVAKSKEAYEDETTYSSTPSIAIGEWKNLMGEFFPKYG